MGMESRLQELIPDIDFTDNAGLIEANKQKIQEFLNKLAEKADQFGLHINMEYSNLQWQLWERIVHQDGLG